MLLRTVQAIEYFLVQSLHMACVVSQRAVVLNSVLIDLLAVLSQVRACSKHTSGRSKSLVQTRLQNRYHEFRLRAVQEEALVHIPIQHLLLAKHLLLVHHIEISGPFFSTASHTNPLDIPPHNIFLRLVDSLSVWYVELPGSVHLQARVLSVVVLRVATMVQLSRVIHLEKHILNDILLLRGNGTHTPALTLL